MIQQCLFLKLDLGLTVKISLNIGCFDAFGLLFFILQTPAEFLARYSAAIHNFTFNNVKIMPASVPNIGFDLVWAMALGLNKTAERVAQLDDSGCEDLSGDIVPLEDFDYSNEKMGCILRQSIGSIKFDGLSVSHMFYNVCWVFLLNSIQNENIYLNSWLLNLFFNAGTPTCTV